MPRKAPKGWWGWIMLLQVFIQLKIFRCEKLGYPFPIWWIRKNSVMSFNSKPKSLVITELWIISTIVHVAITSVTKILMEIFSSFQIFWGWILAVFQLTSTRSPRNLYLSQIRVTIKWDISGFTTENFENPAISRCNKREFER